MPGNRSCIDLITPFFLVTNGNKAMSYTILEKGAICRMAAGTAFSAVAGPRLALCPSGEIVCSFVAQTALGINDFKPMMARSSDGGASWTDPRPMWPELFGRYSVFGSVSSTPAGQLLFFGSRTIIDVPGEPFWSDETKGLKPNELIWTSSDDHGLSWAPFSVIPQPVAGSAEAPGAMCMTRDGRLVCCYAPYRTFDPNLCVETNLVVSLSSDDGGRSWHAGRMLNFPFETSNGAEAWVVELSDGRLLGTGWHIVPDGDAPNAFAISCDGGKSWGPTGSTGTLGQSTALAGWKNGEALFIYNQRRFGDIGVWLARVRPHKTDFGILSNERIWAALMPALDPTKTSHASWTNFAFGEPALVTLSDDSILATFWTSSKDGPSEIAWVKLLLG